MSLTFFFQLYLPEFLSWHSVIHSNYSSFLPWPLLALTHSHTHTVTCSWVLLPPSLHVQMLPILQDSTQMSHSSWIFPEPRARFLYFLWFPKAVISASLLIFYRIVFTLGYSYLCACSISITKCKCLGDRVCILISL